jgi:hypothetical protein
MIRRGWNVAWVTLVGSCVLFVAAPPCRGQPPDARVGRILADWTQRRESIKAIRYRVFGERIQPKGSFLGRVANEPPEAALPLQDLKSPCEYMLLLDFVGKRVRFESTEQRYRLEIGGLAPFVEKQVFDTRSKTLAWPRAANSAPGYARRPLDADVTIGKHQSDERLMNVVGTNGLSPLLLGTGLVCGVIIHAHFAQKLDADDFMVHGQAVHAGRTCLVLRSYPQSGTVGPIFDEYWIDVERRGLILRQLLFMEGKVDEDWDISYQETPNGWFPQAWAVNMFNGRVVSRYERMRVVEVNCDPVMNDSDFRIPIEPGMIVWEDLGIGRDAKIYRAGADGSLHELVNGVEKAPLWPRFAWLAAVLAVALAAWRILRRVHRYSKAMRTT